MAARFATVGMKEVEGVIGVLLRPLLSVVLLTDRSQLDQENPNLFFLPEKVGKQGISGDVHYNELAA